MEIWSSQDRVAVWHAALQASADQRRALMRILATNLLDGMGALDLDSEEHVRLMVESLETLDGADLLGRASLRHALGALLEQPGEAEALAAEISGLLREAAGASRLDLERRVRAIEMASQWCEHVVRRRRAEPAVLSVGDVAACLGVRTQAVYRWLQNGHIEAACGPGGSWRIPAAQFAREQRPRTSRAQLDALQVQLIRLHGDRTAPGQHLCRDSDDDRVLAGSER